MRAGAHLLLTSAPPHAIHRVVHPPRHHSRWRRGASTSRRPRDVPRDVPVPHRAPVLAQRRRLITRCHADLCCPSTSAVGPASDADDPDAHGKVSTGAMRMSRRRSTVKLLGGLILATGGWTCGHPGWALARDADTDDASYANGSELPEVTEKVYLDVGVCDSNVRADRALGSTGAVCGDPVPVGRIVIGLYGNLVPTTVANFVTLVAAPSGEGYVGTVFHRVTPGRYVLAGQAGSARLGQVQAPRLPANPELLSGKAFALRHLRPGTVSLALGAATGEAESAGFGGGGSGAALSGSQNTEFLITTGPAPVPSLDGANLVFGRVLEGMDVVTAIAAVPTFKPSSNARAWNQVAEWLHDDRAEKARAVWSKPTKAIVITGGGRVD